MAFDPHFLFIIGIDLILLGSLISLEYHFYKTYKKPKITLLDALLLNIVAIPAVHLALINNLIGMDLLLSLSAPILAFIASASLIIKEKKK